MNKTAIAVAMALTLGTGVAQAANWAGDFTMYGPGGTPMGTDPGVTGTELSSMGSTTPFFGFVWTAHDLTTYGAGSYSIDTIEGGIYNVTVGAGQIMGHVLFDWNTTTDIDVINVWDVTANLDGTTTYTSTDVDGTGWAGLKMIDGAFPGFSANFNMTSEVPVPAAVWLFGSGLLGLVGVARRRKTA